MRRLLIPTLLVLMAAAAVMEGGRIENAVLFCMIAWSLFISVAATIVAVQARDGVAPKVKVPKTNPPFSKAYCNSAYALTTVLLASIGGIGWIVAGLFMVHWFILVAMIKTLREKGYVKEE